MMVSSIRTVFPRAVCLSWLLSGWLIAEERTWPQFRGPKGDGHANASSLPVKFNEKEGVVWKAPIHGKAWSSPVVWNDKVWMTTANEEGTELSIVAVDKQTGKVIHDEILFHIATPQFCHKFNSYASPTPVIEEDRIYVTFGSPATACLDTKTGQKIWERTDFVCNHFRAAGSSPILWKNLLIMNFDGSDYQYVVALDKTSGKDVWKTDRSVDFQDLDPEGKPKAEGDLRKGFSTPHIFEVAGKPLLFSSGSKAHYVYDPATGAEVWRYENRDSHSPCTRPAFTSELAFVPAGHGKAGMVALQLGKQGVAGEEAVAWKMTQGFSQKPSVTLVDDLLFVFEDRGVASCLNAKTGESLWKERIGGNFSSSPVYNHGRLYIGNEEGLFLVLAAEREFRLLAENEFDDGFMASPCVSDSSLFLRSRTHLYRIQ
jgi:outer membrane protein assembly factor BamB